MFFHKEIFQNEKYLLENFKSLLNKQKKKKNKIFEGNLIKKKILLGEVFYKNYSNFEEMNNFFMDSQNLKKEYELFYFKEKKELLLDQNFNSAQEEIIKIENISPKIFLINFDKKKEKNLFVIVFNYNRKWHIIFSSDLQIFEFLQIKFLDLQKKFIFLSKVEFFESSSIERINYIKKLSTFTEECGSICDEGTVIIPNGNRDGFKKLNLFNICKNKKIEQKCKEKEKNESNEKKNLFF